MPPLLQTVSTLMSPDILTCSPDMPVHEAALLMSERRCGSIVVMEGGRAVGIWTETDAMRSGFADAVRGNPRMREVMSSPVVTLAPDVTAHDAVVCFHDRGIRHALIEQDGAYLGMLSMTDIIRLQGGESALGLRRLESIELPEVTVADGEERLSVALDTMKRTRRDAVVIMLGDGYGILTQRDLVRLLGEGLHDARLADVCSQPLLAVSVRTTLQEARRMLLIRQIRHLGVLDVQGRLVSLIGFGDILRSFEQHFLLELHQMLFERDLALQESQHHLQLAERVFISTLEGIVITDGSGIIQSVNPAFSRITGYSKEEAVGQTLALIRSGKYTPSFYQYFWHCLIEHGSWEGEMINRHKSGALFTEHLQVSAIRDEQGRIRQYVGVFSDITQRKQAEERLQFLTNHDALTGLPNRTLIMQRVDQLLLESEAARQGFAVLFVNLDRFRLVNDSLGHAAGDELLVSIATSLKTLAPGNSMVGRLSGDEFVLIVERLEGVQKLASQVQALLDGMTGETEVGGHRVFVTASIGISLYPHDGHQVETLLANANAAMNRAKERGTNTFQFYTVDMNARAIERLHLEAALHGAQARGELELWYQPKIDMLTGALHGAEALLRWHHPDRGLVSPEVFIPIAEDSSLIVSLGDWVLETACARIRAWRDRGLQPGRVAVNISGRQFKFGTLPGTVLSALTRHDLPASALELEVTESVVMEEGDATIAVLRQLSDAGIYLSIDDFGTGYSSLAYLKRLPVQGLKIDRSFIMDLHDDGDDAAITSAIISVAGSLGLELVAEGVEREEQREFLLRQGCRIAQGFFYSQPLPAAAFEALLLARKSLSPD